MNSRYRMLVIGLVVLAIVAWFGISRFFAKKSPDRTAVAPAKPPVKKQIVTQQEPLMTPVPSPGVTIVHQPHSPEFLVDQLFLTMYEAGAGDLSACNNQDVCIEYARLIKSFLCVGAVCNGSDQSKKPTDCFDNITEKYTSEIQDKINNLICPVIENPTPETRQAFLDQVPGSTENNLVETAAYVFAHRGDVDKCREYIKGYVGPYGLRWNYEWFRALSGCRILARTSTLGQEKKDFLTWAEVLNGANSCENIVNSDLRDACTALGGGVSILPQR